MIISNKKKRILLHRAKKEFRRRKRSKDKKKAKRIRMLGLSKSQVAALRQREKEQMFIQRTFASYNHIEAPRCLSMIENTEGTLAFISDLEKSLNNNEKVFVVLRHVDKIASGAIVVLLSIMIKFKNKGVPFNGDHPKNAVARQNLTNSGFFERLYQKDGDAYSIRGRCGIFTHADKVVDSRLSDELIQKVSTLIWGQPYRCTGVQQVYIELMQNTNNHASLHGPNEHHWYTTVTYNQKKKKACFSFIDYGVGIIQSINKNEKGKFWNALSRIMNLLKPRNNGDFLRLLLDGSVHKTATGHYYRGKGLPGIYKAFQDNKISNLVVITNDAFADCAQDSYKTLNNKFEGTYIYWELDYNNKKLPLV
ncbi:MAG: hypothetical protein LIR46_09605 [Bacteroidota bacterium]|nr:hypothetical protein [Bacteroidota bacterium]